MKAVDFSLPFAPAKALTRPRVVRFFELRTGGVALTTCAPLQRLDSPITEQPRLPPLRKEPPAVPMPAPNTPWPLPEYADAIRVVRRDDALLTGKLDILNERRVKAGPRPYSVRAQYNGGIVGGVAKAVFGQPVFTQPHEGKSHMVTHHLPVADELVTALADHLAGKPPVVKLAPEDAGNTKAAAALAELTEHDSFASDWWKAVYTAGALGWVYGRVVWNLNVQPSPWIEWVDADNGMAEFENGRQVSVIFWDTYKAHDDKKGEKADKVYRLLQRHTAGQIEYQLYQGSDDGLGMPVPFTDCPETAHLAELDGLHDGTLLTTGAELPTAHMLSNYRPRREWRHEPLLRHYSVSDVGRGSDLFQTIDENWSQFQHEVEAARGRLFVDESLLETRAPGAGQFFDMWRDIFPAGAVANADAKPTFEQVQFNMRVEQFLNLIDSDIRKAVSALGLSPFTVDMDAQASGDMTATETKARTKRTRATAEAKGRHQRTHLSALLTAFLQMDAAINGYAPPTKPVLVSLPDQFDISESEITGLVVQLANSELISRRAAIRKLHPEWTDDEVTAEVDAINAQNGYAADPFNLPGDVNPATQQIGE